MRNFASQITGSRVKGEKKKKKEIFFTSRNKWKPLPREYFHFPNGATNEEGGEGFGRWNSGPTEFDASKTKEGSIAATSVAFTFNRPEMACTCNHVFRGIPFANRRSTNNRCDNICSNHTRLMPARAKTILCASVLGFGKDYFQSTSEKDRCFFALDLVSSRRWKGDRFGSSRIQASLSARSLLREGNSVGFNVGGEFVVKVVEIISFAFETKIGKD